MSKLSVPRPPQRFDLQKFETMAEPFSIRVEKHRGSTKHEVTPPPFDEAGWTKERVRQLENWIVTEWSGGGQYTFMITDSSNPPNTMEWPAYYLPADYPEKIPPTLQGATSVIAQPQPPQVPHVRPLSAAMPPASFYQASAPMAMPQVASQPMMVPNTVPQPSYYPQPQGSMYAQQPQFYPHMQSPTESAEVRALREEANRAREQAAQREFERRVAEIEARSDKRFGELQALIQQMGQQMVSNLQQRTPAVDPVVEQLKEQNRRLEEQMRTQAEQHERTRRENELRDQIARGQEETRRLVELANQRAEQVIRESGNKGPDPQFLLMMETMKEIARSSQSQFERMRDMVMNPRDVMALAKETSNSTEHVVGQISRQYESMFNLQRAFTEQIAQMNQQGSGGNDVIGLVRDIGDKIGEYAGRYQTGKSREAVEQMRSQAEIAKANAEAIRATQDRMAELARLEAAIKSGAVVQMPDGTFRASAGREQAAISSGTIPVEDRTNGAHANGNGKAKAPWIPPKAAVVDLDKTNGTPGLSGPKVEPKGATVTPIGQAKQSTERRIKGKTDAEWFGPMESDVNQLRAAVDLFVEGTNQNPPAKPEGSASPEDCAMIIRQAAMVIANQQVFIPAMAELLFQGSVADFLDVLLPDAHQLYRDDVVKLLMQDEDEDEDDNEDESKGETAQAQA